MENKPDKLINTKETFGVECDFEVFGFNTKTKIDSWPRKNSGWIRKCQFCS